jgi:fatty-acyl-CoA synthase
MMGITSDGLSYWQAETEDIDLLDLTMGDLLDRRAEEIPSQEAIVYSCFADGAGENAAGSGCRHLFWANGG